VTQTMRAPVAGGICDFASHRPVGIRL